MVSHPSSAVDGHMRRWVRALLLVRAVSRVSPLRRPHVPVPTGPWSGTCNSRRRPAWRAKSVARGLVNLGREDELDRDALARLVASINRCLGVPNAPTPNVSAMVGEQLTVAESRPMGSVSYSTSCGVSSGSTTRCARFWRSTVHDRRRAGLGDLAGDQPGIGGRRGRSGGPRHPVPGRLTDVSASAPTGGHHLSAQRP